MFEPSKIFDAQRLAVSGIDLFAKIMVRGVIALFFVCVAIQIIYRYW